MIRFKSYFVLISWFKNFKININLMTEIKLNLIKLKKNINLKKI